MGETDESLALKEYYKSKCHDLVKLADRIHGLGSIYFRFREWVTVHCINEYCQGHILDVGCGTGLITRNLPEGTVGLDISAESIKKAKCYCKNAIFIVGDADNLPFKKEGFDLVICTQMLEHISPCEKAMSEIFRVLRTGQFLIGTVANDDFLWKLRRISGTNPSDEPMHIHYKRYDLQNLLVGLKLESLVHFPLFFLFVASKNR